MTGNWRDPILINTIGHTAGVMLFGLIIALLIRDGRARGMSQTKLSLTAALLAFGWNFGCLVVLASHDPSLIEFIATVSFSMLSLLPAVLFQVAACGQHGFLVPAGYIVSSLAVALHFWEPFSATAGLHEAALICIVVGFGFLTIAAFLVGRKRRQHLAAENPESISLACLLLFTSSFLHFGYHHLGSPWAAEIAWHHIGIPVALIVLLRDYRFLLLDTFIRFLISSGLAAAYIAAVLVLDEKLGLWSLVRPSMFLTGIALGVLCLVLISFGYLRNALQAWVSRFVFRRRKLDGCMKEIANIASSARSEDELLSVAGEKIANHFGAERSTIAAELTRASGSSTEPVWMGERAYEARAGQRFRPEVQLPLRFSSGEARCLVLGPRRGGRKYRGDDLDDMRRLAATVVEHVERFRAEELRRLVNQAELRALQAQINPHFLFNALNTLYGTIDRGSREARRMVVNMAEMFRYFLRGDRTLIPLSEELRIIEAYLEIEALRVGERLKTELIVSDSVKSTLIPVLSVQPLVENAVKHGVAAKQEGGRVSLKAIRIPAGLLITVEDTGVGFEHSQSLSPNGTGVGLDNVRRRLALCYGTSSELQIESSASGSSVSFVVPDSSPLEHLPAELETSSTAGT